MSTGGVASDTYLITFEAQIALCASAESFTVFSLTDWFGDCWLLDESSDRDAPWDFSFLDGEGGDSGGEPLHCWLPVEKYRLCTAPR